MNRSTVHFAVILLAGLIAASCTNSISTSPSQSTPVPTPSPVVSPTLVRTPDVSKYETRDKDVFGLYYVRSHILPDDGALIISDDNAPIPPKANDPGEVTIPGFYLNREERVDFERVSIVGKQVHFKTREYGGIVYEFDGKIGKEADPELDLPVPFIKGTLKKIENGKVLKTENVKFGHAVIA